MSYLLCWSWDDLQGEGRGSEEINKHQLRPEEIKNLINLEVQIEPENKCIQRLNKGEMSKN